MRSIYDRLCAYFDGIERMSTVLRVGGPRKEEDKEEWRGRQPSHYE